MNAQELDQLHILSVLVENKSGVLARVASLFARRGFNIHSLAVAPTNRARFSRITVVVDLESAPLEQITKQLDKLIHVVKIEELRPTDAVERELMLVTVVKGEDPHDVLDIANRATAGTPSTSTTTTSHSASAGRQNVSTWWSAN